MTACMTPDASPAAGRSHAGSRLLADPGQMTLRVRGPGGQEQTAQIRSPKCTIGSAAGCTLRICAPGVGPLHCWILRGTAGTLVRRLHGPAALNGSTFDELPLRIGDRLRIGSVELEAIECNQPAPTPAPLFPPPPAAPAVSGAELAALQVELSIAREHAARLEGEARQGFQSSITAAERADQLSDALNAAHAQLEQAARELGTVQETVTRQNEQLNAYQAQADEFRVGTASTAAELEAAREQLAAAGRERSWLEAEVEQARQVLANEKSNWQEELTQLQRRLAQRDAEIAALRSGGGQTSPMTVVLDELAGDSSPETGTGEFQSKCQELQAQLAAQQSELETLRRLVGEHTIIEGRFEKLTRDYDLKCIELDEARAQAGAAAATGSRAADEAEERAAALSRWQEDLAAREQRLADEQQKLATQQEAVSAQSDQAVADRQQLESQRAETAQQQARVEQERAALTAEQQQFAAQREQLLAAAASTQINDREPQLTQHAEELEQQIAAANSRLADVELLRQQVTQERAAVEERALCLEDRHNELQARSQQLDNQMQELRLLREQLDGQIAEFTQRQEMAQCNEAAAPGNVVPPPGSAKADIGQTMPPSRAEAAVNVTAPWQPPERMLAEDASAGESEQSDEVLARLVQSGIWRGDASTGNAQEPAAPAEPAPSAGGRSGGDEEESIELYMERLLKRVRGETSVRPVVPSPAVAPEAPQPVADEEAETLEEPAADEADGYSPRHTAPELTTNLSAMRELANTAARSAIDRHFRKNKGKQAAGKIFIALLTLGFSGIASFRAWQLHSLEAAVAAGIGGAAGAYWLLASLRRLLGLMRLQQPQTKQSQSERQA